MFLKKGQEIKVKSDPLVKRFSDDQNRSYHRAWDQFTPVNSPHQSIPPRGNSPHQSVLPPPPKFWEYKTSHVNNNIFMMI